MTDTREELNGAIEKCIQEGTFSLEAIKAIGELKEKAERLASELDRERELSKNRDEEIQRLEAQADRNTAEITRLTTLIEGMQERDKSATIAIHDAAKHKAVAEAYRESMCTVFRPHTVRKTVHDTIPVALSSGSDGYGNPMSYTSQENKTTETSETNE